MADGSPAPLWANLMSEVEARHVPGDEYPSTGEGFLEALDQGYTVDLREPWLHARRTAVAEPGSAVSRITLLKTIEPLLTATDPEPGVAVSPVWVTRVST